MLGWGPGGGELMVLGQELPGMVRANTPRDQCPSHLFRKLQDALGGEAADDLNKILDGIEGDRGDIRELRHEVQSLATRMELLVERALREQTRFFFLAWGVILAAIVGLYAR